MINFEPHHLDIKNKGFTTINNVFPNTQVEALLNMLEETDSSRPNVRKNEDIFAIRQFLKEIPHALPLLMTTPFQNIIHTLFGKDYFIVKSIYFDKPGQSNWFVSYHQDLTISVDRKIALEAFGPWTVKQNQYAVQPPLHILENNFTVRIHLDDTDENNGALRVIPKSHLKGVYRPETIDWSKETETTCNVQKGGIMIMRPLLLHASGRTTNNKKRRVIHLEFSNQVLPEPLQWSEGIQ